MTTKCSYCECTKLNGKWALYFPRKFKSEKNITHGICPECLEKKMKELEAM